MSDMNDYEAIYDDAFMLEMGDTDASFNAGIAAVVAAAKRDTLTDLIAQFPSHGLLGFKAVIEQRLSEVQAAK
ncbi:hypothetical protein E3T43_01195 [Cryobacterium sp. Hh7]|uniref:hypothetical protein n=1 Tax=Cryobacterium sp. Hh7 TaxID=1259159 RepID=UPI0010698C55|nr:hypothetical protein [Cryobacterium sp. Hh7]TFD61116.1 hypothetical protein E3T43_01195 [Cryobacterium sp. Hh7]